MMEMPAGPDTPEYPGDTQEQKVSQVDANYRRGSPMQHCGVCTYYEGGDQCSRVESPISGFGISDIFNMQKNPFGSTIGPQEAQMINSMMNSPPDQSRAVASGPAPGPGPAPGLQIGTKTY